MSRLMLVLMVALLGVVVTGCAAHYGGGNVPRSLDPSYGNADGPPPDGWYGENPGRVIVQAVVGEGNELIRYSAGRGRYELERAIFDDSRRDKARESYHRYGDDHYRRSHRRNSDVYCTSDDRRPACRW